MSRGAAQGQEELDRIGGVARDGEGYLRREELLGGVGVT
jgi:hypothetical protein